jgi:hypothetical protein
MEDGRDEVRKETQVEVKRRTCMPAISCMSLTCRLTANYALPLDGPAVYCTVSVIKGSNESEKKANRMLRKR